MEHQILSDIILLVWPSALLVWAIAVLLTLFGTSRALVFLKSKTSKPTSPDRPLPPVSILKPLKGSDADLQTNLESFFTLDYPKYELLFSVAEADDPALTVVQELMRKYSHVNCRLVVGAVNLGPNPKINNLIRTYEMSTYELVLISDSNTRFQASHLRELVLEFGEKAALQTSIVAGTDGKGLGGQLESAILNTFYARSSLILDALGHTCVIGKCMLFRRSVIYRTRGLRSLKNHMAEDYAVGRKLHLLGYPLQMSTSPVTQHIGKISFAAFWSRHVRWGRLRKNQSPLGFLFEPLFSAVLSGVLGALAFSQLWGVNPYLVITAHLAFWGICDALMASRVGGKLDYNFLPVWLLREATHIPLWLHIAVGNSIEWRGQTYKLKKFSVLEKRESNFNFLPKTGA